LVWIFSWSQNDIFFDDINLIEYIQKVLGYDISVTITEQIILIFFGNGSNGKEVPQYLLKKLLGNYYRQLTKDVIIENGKDQYAGAASPQLMQLLGTRLGFVDESEMGSKLNECVVKI